MKRFAFLGILVCLGCGGVDDADLFSTHGGGTTSACGYTSTSASSSSGTGGNSSTSSSSSSGGVGGCSPQVTCQSIGAECGTILDDGCGVSIDCGNNCSAPLVCGGGGQQFKCGCTPKTCFQLGKNCGSTDDGCGNPIDCGGCDPSNYQTTCGDFGWDTTGTFRPGSNNVCGGGCEAITMPNINFDCAGNFPQYPHEWHCAQPKSNNAPPTGSACVLIDAFADNQWWCCEEGK